MNSARVGQVGLVGLVRQARHGGGGNSPPPPYVGGYLRSVLSRYPETLGFIVLLVAFNAPLLSGHSFGGLMFDATAVERGEWWRLVTHPFVHVTWYHLLLDATAFVTLYISLETGVFWRTACVIGAGSGSLLLSWLMAPAAGIHGLCGLSGIAHGLMAISALEMITLHPPKSPEWRIGWVTFGMVVAKAAFEAVSGRMFFAFLDFGLLGDPVAVAHAGGVVGALAVAFLGRLRFDTTRSLFQKVRRKSG